MYKRIIVAVAGALFSLLALLAVIITDLYDRDFPHSIGVESRFSLEFSESGLSITEAFETLEELDARWDLGLVKVAPDLASDGEGILHAQFAAYVVWLQSLALVALVVAFTVAATISALITALLQAKRDFPLRLAGRSSVRILQSRVVKQLLVGVGLVGIVVVLQRPDASIGGL